MESTIVRQEVKMGSLNSPGGETSYIGECEDEMRWDEMKWDEMRCERLWLMKPAISLAKSHAGPDLSSLMEIPVGPREVW
jgi:hypothetical protein